MRILRNARISLRRLFGGMHFISVETLLTPNLTPVRFTIRHSAHNNGLRLHRTRSATREIELLIMAGQDPAHLTEMGRGPASSNHPLKSGLFRTGKRLTAHSLCQALAKTLTRLADSPQVPYSSKCTLTRIRPDPQRYGPSSGVTGIRQPLRKASPLPRISFAEKLSPSLIWRLRSSMG